MLSVNIGIDFGTSYTKAAFRDNYNRGGFVHFGEAGYYMPSILYYSQGRVSMERIDSSDVEERYFKYTVIHDDLPVYCDKAKARIKAPPQVLFCVYYLANIINIVKDYALKECAPHTSPNEVEWVITLGVPIDNYDYDGANKSIYDRILMAADELSRALAVNGQKPMMLRDVEAVWNKHSDSLAFNDIGPLNTLAELYAESLVFILDRNTPVGLYALVDVGGGTVDMAVIMKNRETREDGTVVYVNDILSHCIEPLGIESVVQKIARGELDDTKRQQYRQDLMLDTRDVEINRKAEKLCGSELSTAFAACVNQAIDAPESRLPREDNRGVLPVIICGGGADYMWYSKRVIDDCRERLGGRNVHMAQQDAKTLLGLDGNVQQRLIIAQQLSLRIEDIPEVKGYPWYFEHRAKEEHDAMLHNGAEEADEGSYASTYDQ